METKDTKEHLNLEGAVRLTITGGGGEITTETDAQCYYKNQSYYLLFEEGIGEDGRQNAIVFSSGLKISRDQVTLRRSRRGEDGKSGGPVMEMSYRDGTKDGPGHFVDYPTPYGTLRLEIRTDRILRDEREKELTVTVFYRLLQEEQEISSDRLVIRVRKYAT